MSKLPTAPIMLGKRARAMLREMGVRVWLPPPAPTPSPSPAPGAAPSAPDLQGPPAVVARAPANPAVAVPQAAPTRTATQAATVTAATPSLPQPAPTTAPPARRTPVANDIDADGQAAAWQLGQVHQPFLDLNASASATPHAARWLVLAETPVAALRASALDTSAPSAHSAPFTGEAGTLLANMLRAARLPHAAGVRLVPLARMAHKTAASPAQADLQAALAALLAGNSAAPDADPASARTSGGRTDIVLIMGRLAAQAVLQSNEPLGKLRGRTHMLLGVPAIVTYDAAYLLRNPLDKAKAWDDLCLAMQTVAGLAPDTSAMPNAFDTPDASANATV